MLSDIFLRQVRYGLLSGGASAGSFAHSVNRLRSLVASLHLKSELGTGKRELS